MRLLNHGNQREWEKDLASFLLGAIGGLAAGILISRAIPRTQSAAAERKPRTSLIPSRIKPARMYRAGADQPELNRLEEAVFNGFMDDAKVTEA